MDNVGNIKLLMLTYIFRVEDSLIFTEFPGIRIRSQIGYCLYRRFGPDSDVYRYGFRHEAADRFRSGYVLSRVPPKLEFRAGEHLSFRIVLIGETVRFAREFTAAVNDLEDAGLGYAKEGGPGRIRLLRILGSHGGEWMPDDGIDLSFPVYRARTLRQFTDVLLIPDTPIRIPAEKAGKRALTAGELRPEDLAGSAWRRIGHLHREYGLNMDIDPEVMPPELFDFSITVHKGRSCDEKQFITEKYDMSGGFLNVLEIQGNLTLLLPLLLLCRKIHIGEHGSFGLGAFKLAVLNGSQFTAVEAGQALQALQNRKKTIRDEHISAEELRHLSESVSRKEYIVPPMLKYRSGSGREISVPDLRDRIVQRWAAGYLNMLVDDSLHPNAYGYRKDKGAAKAVRRAAHEIKHGGYRFAVHLDIKKYFDQIDRKRLLALLREYPVNNLVTGLVSEWVHNGGIRYGYQYESGDAGIAQGNVVSPVLSNLYLMHFDYYINSLPDTMTLRYCDDLLILGKDRKQVEKALYSASAYLNRVCGLRLHENPGISALQKETVQYLGFALDSEKIQMASERITDKIQTLSVKLKAADGVESRVAALTEYLQKLQAYYGEVLGKEDWLKCRRHILHELKKKDLAGNELDAVQCLLETSDLHTQRDESFEITGSENRHRKKQKQLKMAVTEAGMKRTLIIDRAYSYLRLRKGSLLIENGKEEKVFSFKPLRQIIVSASKSCRISAPLMLETAKRGLPIILLNEKGQEGAVIGPLGKLRPDQIFQQDIMRKGPVGFDLAVQIIRAKAENQRALMKYWNKSRGGEYEIQIRKITDVIGKISMQQYRDEGAWKQDLMLLEAEAASFYWAVVKRHLKRYSYPGRIRKGADDPINSALNYGYGILQAHVNTSLSRTAVIPELGIFHADQPGKPTMTYDIMEMYRQPFIDRAVLATASRGKLLECLDTGYLKDESRRQVMRAVLRSLATAEDYGGVLIPRSEIIYRQVLDFQRTLTGGEKRFKPYIMKKW